MKGKPGRYKKFRPESECRGAYFVDGSIKLARDQIGRVGGLSQLTKGSRPTIIRPAQPDLQQWKEQPWPIPKRKTS
jgi:hypothetical protein